MRVPLSLNLWHWKERLCQKSWSQSSHSIFLEKKGPFCNTKKKSNFCFFNFLNRRNLWALDRKYNVGIHPRAYYYPAPRGWSKIRQGVNDTTTKTHAARAAWLRKRPRVLARRATVTDCEEASGSWRLYAANLARRGRALAMGKRRSGGVTGGAARRGWSCVRRGILEHTDGSPLGVAAVAAAAAAAAARRGAAWRGTAWHGAARHSHSKARRSEARRGEARRGEAKRGSTRHSVARRGRRDRSESSLACSRAPLPAATCGRLLFSSFSLFLSFSLTHARLRPRPRRAPRRTSVSLRAVLLPSHREAASKQEPIWISVDLFLHSICLCLSLSVSFYLSLSVSLPFFNRCLVRLHLRPSGFGVNEN